ncbi:Helix-turn-helix domain-containing protein [Flexibacter flexilis DSM 6793]|uniref:Helix-turn-helix domain-containing protein n=1 Tax=Flexibacter flexilis DSM 6793 TaxID=927664 RepID=A0A1I1FZ32_9BACT|nr:DUF6597 domain-containing transcriptional factor [Flexibacter flexilis]SFC04545.1 Helix-turn-helix domain-containing protein [Flexibacter flexilis DSM 6793]
MILKHICPRPELRDFIDTFWVFEADFGVPVTDSRIIAPNGKAKFIYPYTNALATIDNGVLTSYPEQDIFFIGIWDKPVTLTSTAQVTGTIGIELSPSGLHRFTDFAAFEIVNQIYSFADVYGGRGRQLIERLRNTPNVTEKVELLQLFLVGLLEKSRHNSLIDYSVQLIHGSAGLLTIGDLVEKTGYSKRYIDLLFREYVGISPKTLSAISRFQRFYYSWANAQMTNFYAENLYEHYYDQAHFIKEFKKFTGHAPKQYANLPNDFGKIFYRSAP